MKIKNHLSARFCIAFCVTLFSLQSFGETIRLPINGRPGEFPATDLVDRSGQLIPVRELLSRQAQGEDLSLLEPQGRDRLWRNQKFSSHNRHEIPFPSGPNPTVRLHAIDSVRPSLFSALVKDENGKTYVLRTSRLTHWVLMRVALLRKLGYFLPSPQFYGASNEQDGLLKVQFRNLQEKQDFLAAMGQALRSPSYKDWLAFPEQADNQSREVTLLSATLDPLQRDSFFEIHWGILASDLTPGAEGVVADLQHRRTYRALLVPMSVSEEMPLPPSEGFMRNSPFSQLATAQIVSGAGQRGLYPESVNRFTPIFGRIWQNEVLLTLRSGRSFVGVTTYQDAKWMARRVMKLSVQDLEDIVQEGFWPTPLRELIKAKLQTRIHHLSELFDLKDQLQWRPPNIRDIQSPPYVINGKLNQERIPGFPQRFAHGDPDSPFTTKDLTRFLTITAISTAIQRLIEEINKKLEIQSIQDVVNQDIQRTIRKINRHIAEKPNEILTEKLRAWGGPIGSFFIGANREVTTGTFFESTAPIQLVDSIHVGASAGYFGSISGLANLHPNWATFFVGGSTQVNFNRSYIHVRPLDSLKEGVTYPWRNLAIPFLKSELRSTLTNEEEGLQKFLDELKVGEVFTVTDSLTLGGFANLSTPIDLLMGLTPVGIANSLSIGTDVQRVFVIHQTVFTRTEEGLQISRRTSDSFNKGIQFDVTYYMNLLRLRFERQMTDIQSSAFVIPLKPTDSGLQVANHRRDPNRPSELSSESQLALALQSVFKESSIDRLQEFFGLHRLDLQHEITTHRRTLDLLFRRERSFNEIHRLKMSFPQNPELATGTTPAMEEPSIQLLSARRGQLWGNDFLRFLSSLFNAVIERPGLVQLSRADNPANSPFGHAFWKVIQTEKDLSEIEPLRPVALINETWGGWKLNRRGLEGLLKELNQKLEGASLRSHRILPEELFAHSNTLEFYRITARFMIRNEGLQKLTKLFRQQLRGGEPPRSDRDFRSTDGDFFSAFTEGFYCDQEEIEENRCRGKQEFYRICQQEARHTDPRVHENFNRADPHEYRGEYVHRNFYPCMNTWMIELLRLRRQIPDEDPEAKAQWINRVLWILSERFSVSQLAEFLGEENFLFYVNVTGFRSGDEDGDRTLLSHTSGQPGFDFKEWMGVFDFYAQNLGLTPTEVSRTQSGLQ